VITEQAEEERQLMSGITEDVRKTTACGRNRACALAMAAHWYLWWMLSARFMDFLNKNWQKLQAIAFFRSIDSGNGGKWAFSIWHCFQSLASPNYMAKVCGKDY